MTDKNKPIIYYRAGFWRVRYAEGMTWKQLNQQGRELFAAAYKWVGHLNYVVNRQLSA